MKIRDFELFQFTKDICLGLWIASTDLKYNFVSGPTININLYKHTDSVYYQCGCFGQRTVRRQIIYTRT